jgi:hypothetical protein
MGFICDRERNAAMLHARGMPRIFVEYSGTDLVWVKRGCVTVYWHKVHITSVRRWFSLLKQGS